MFKGKTILALIPARGGSKGIPKKNIVDLAGKPLIAWTIEEAKKSKYIDRLILSSDDEEIISVARTYGCEVPFKRPAEIATDKSPTIDAAIHAIKKMKEKYDYMILLQTTSPLRTASDIDAAIRKCILLEADSCVSVVEPRKSPFWTYTKNSQGRIVPLIKKSHFTRRQDLPKTYCLNGAIYVSKTNYIIKYRRFFGENTVPLIMDDISSIDIDSPSDLRNAEFIIKQKMGDK